MFCCRCAPDLRRSFVTFTFQMFECVEKADTMSSVDGFITGCNSFLLSKSLVLGDNHFGTDCVLHACSCTHVKLLVCRVFDCESVYC